MFAAAPSSLLLADLWVRGKGGSWKAGRGRRGGTSRAEPRARATCAACEPLRYLHPPTSHVRFAIEEKSKSGKVENVLMSRSDFDYAINQYFEVSFPATCGSSFAVTG